MLRAELVLFAIVTVISADNVGQHIDDFFNTIGKGIEKAANDVALSVNRFVTDNDDLVAAKKIEDQKAIDAYKQGQINDAQLRTAFWIDQYEYQQAIDDRIRNQYPSGNSYPALNGNYWGADSQQQYVPSNGFNGPYDPRVQNSQYEQMSQGYSSSYPNQIGQPYGQNSPNQISQASSYSNPAPQNSRYPSNTQNTMYPQSSGYGSRKFAVKKL